MRDRDHERKNKRKRYADETRKARYSDIISGDKVLVQQERKNKFSTRFSPVPFTVVKKSGNSLVVRSKEGIQYSRNTSHCKKFVEEFEGEGQTENVTELPVRPEIIANLSTVTETEDVQDSTQRDSEVLREEVSLHKNERIIQEKSPARKEKEN